MASCTCCRSVPRREDFPGIFVVHRLQNSCLLGLHNLFIKESIIVKFGLTVLLFLYLSLPSHTFWSVFISLSSVFIHLYLYLSLSQFSPVVSMYLQLYLPAYLFMSISFYLQYLPTYLLIMLSLGVFCVYVCVYDLGSQMSRYRVCFLGCLCLKPWLHTLCCIHFALDAEHSLTCGCALRKRHFSILMVCILKKNPPACVTGNFSAIMKISTSEDNRSQVASTISWKLQQLVAWVPSSIPIFFLFSFFHTTYMLKILPFCNPKDPLLGHRCIYFSLN